MTLRRLDWRSARDAGAQLAGYSAWWAAFHLLCLTLITAFLRGPTTRLQDLSDVYSANQLNLAGVGALIYILMLLALHPLTSTTSEEVFNAVRFEKRFLPGFLNGAAIAVGLAVALIASGLFRYLGFYLELDEAPITIVGVIVRTAAILVLVYCEEFIFRGKILGALRKVAGAPLAVVLTSLAFCALKAVQFDLGWISLFNLFLISLCLSIRTIADGDFSRGAGFWAGALVVLHPLLSLPVLGQEFQGVLLIKYLEPAVTTELYRYLSGGVGGPVSGFAFSLLLIADAVQGLARHRRLLLQ